MTTDKIKDFAIRYFGNLQPGTLNTHRPISLKEISKKGIAKDGNELLKALHNKNIVDTQTKRKVKTTLATWFALINNPGIPIKNQYLGCPETQFKVIDQLLRLNGLESNKSNRDLMKVKVLNDFFNIDPGDAIHKLKTELENLLNLLKR